MPNGDDRILSEVRASDLEAAAFIHARFNVSDAEESPNKLSSLEVNQQVWQGYKATQTHIVDMDLSPADSVEMR